MSVKAILLEKGGTGGGTIKVDRIFIETPPTKTAYKAGETFDPTGMVVKADYAIGGIVITTTEVTGYSYSTAPLTVDMTSITISYSENGVLRTTEQSISVTKTNVTIPTYVGTMTYNGNEQTPTFTNDPGDLTTKSGDLSKINAGDYSTIFTLNNTDYYQWSDESITSKNVNWSIGKKAPEINLSAESVTLDANHLTAEITVTADSDGALSVESSDINVATASLDENIVTVSHVNQTTGTATVTVSQAESDNYLVGSAAAQVNAQFRAYLYGFDLVNADSNPDTRVSYPSDVENTGFAAAKMTFGGSFSYGGWPSTPGEKFMPRPCMLKFDGTVDYYLDPNDYTKKADGTASDVANVNYGGNAMMEWPKIYTKRWETNGVYHFRCSDQKVDSDYECWCNYDINNNEIEHFYTSIYFGSKDSSERMRSISGQVNWVNTGGAQPEIDAAKLNGADIWYTDVMADRFLIQDLLIMIGKSTNGQETFGYGRCASSNSNAIAPGTMNNKGLFWGSNDQTSGVKAFGMENLWGNIWRRQAGWILVSRQHKVKLTRGTKDGSTAADYNTTGNGYIAAGATGPGSNGYISAMTTKAYGRLPSTPSGSDSTYECDYLYQDNNSHYAICGGNWNNTLLVGPFFVTLRNVVSSTSAYYGAALSCKPLAT